MPALHCATSRSTPLAMNIGEPTARRRRVRVRESWTQQAPGPREFAASGAHRRVLRGPGGKTGS
jgi:hypothetical protein